MHRYYGLRADGRLAALAEADVLVPPGQQIDLPEDFDPETMLDWRVVDGGVVSDPLPAPEEEPYQADALAAENRLLHAKVQALADHNDMYDELIAEMAMEVYK